MAEMTAVAEEQKPEAMAMVVVVVSSAVACSATAAVHSLHLASPWLAGR